MEMNNVFSAKTIVEQPFWVYSDRGVIDESNGNYFRALKYLIVKIKGVDELRYYSQVYIEAPGNDISSCFSRHADGNFDSHSAYKDELDFEILTFYVDCGILFGSREEVELK